MWAPSPPSGAAGDGPGSKVARAAAMFDEIRHAVPAAMDHVLQCRDSATTYSVITGLRGIGRFIGYQICVDLGYWNVEVYNEHHHTVLGPGARRGLRWLFPAHPPQRAEAALRCLDAQQEARFRSLGVDLEELFCELPRGARRLNSMAIECSLCEGDKYFRLYYNRGHFKQQYRGAGATPEYLRDFEAVKRMVLSDPRRWCPKSTTPCCHPMPPIKSPQDPPPDTPCPQSKPVPASRGGSSLSKSGQRAKSRRSPRGGMPLRFIPIPTPFPSVPSPTALPLVTASMAPLPELSDANLQWLPPPPSIGLSHCSAYPTECSLDHSCPDPTPLLGVDLRSPNPDALEGVEEDAGRFTGTLPVKRQRFG
eukprot:GGOE01043427.1.p2 GENE.GGOE01043427.1~~GGOE01043427.1.p2  ORF type:complete len:365 (+),score=46.71 GGOE01043427.1:478-1572(+)